MAAKIPPPVRERYVALRNEGYSIRLATEVVGVSYAWAKGFERQLRADKGSEWVARREAEKFGGVRAVDRLVPEASRALVDFEFFRRRYLGHVSLPWHVEAAAEIVDLLASPDKEFLVSNVAPGCGKTTLIHDVACWLIVRDRRIRILFGSRTESNARRLLRRVRRSLERTSAVSPPSELVDRGLAVAGEGILGKDFGSFRPVQSEVWRADEFVVAQLQDAQVEEKEPTASSYGMDSGVLGNRFNFIAWDDVVDSRTIRSIEAIETQRVWWDDEAETRLEPGGLLWLCGQRLSPNDLYRFCLDKVVDVDPDDDDVDPADGPRRVYRHVVYRAHDESKCEGKHKRAEAEPWPAGCLLDPHRLPWRDLRAIQATNPRKFAVVYQQEDADPEDVLVPDPWIWGGTESDGSVFPGCVDENRGLCELPPALAGPKVSVATVDPSGTKMWALQWWCTAVNSEAQQFFLMDLENRAMTSNELLDWNADDGRFYGWMEDWQARSVEMGMPITHWVVEVNAAQRYLLAYDHIRRWRQKWGVSIVPHTTSMKKLDPDYGPWIMRDHFRHGRIRLPGKQQWLGGGDARMKMMKLVDQVTRWPNSGVKDDQVMAAWFYFAHLPQIRPVVTRPPLLKRPSWMRRTG